MHFQVYISQVGRTCIVGSFPTDVELDSYHFVVHFGFHFEEEDNLDFLELDQIVVVCYMVCLLHKDSIVSCQELGVVVHTLGPTQGPASFAARLSQEYSKMINLALWVVALAVAELEDELVVVQVDSKNMGLKMLEFVGSVRR
jgi:hypothetical protein